MKPIKLSKIAADYVRSEARYLRQRNQQAAKDFSLAIKKAKSMLQDFPESGNQMHGLLIAGGRTLVVGDYLLDYIYDGRQIEVTNVRHGRMVLNAPDVDLDEDLDDDYSGSGPSP